MSFDAAAAEERIKDFNIHSPTYKTINAVPLTADIIIPKAVSSGKRPIIVRIHGGYLITGSSLFLGIFAPWMLDYAARKQAIIVSPNYRKLPEAKGKDLLHDLDDFWTWVKRDLPTEVNVAAGGKVEADLERILVLGQSAGGYLAAQSALRPISAPLVKATILAYPMLDMRSPWFAQAFDKHPGGRPMLPTSVLQSHISTTSPNAVVGAVDPPERYDLAIAAVQQGRFVDFLGPEEDCYPFDVLRRVRAFPKACFIYHGSDDTAVSVEGTKKWVELLEEVVPGVDVVMKLVPGDHGDSGLEDRPNIEAGWLKEGLDVVEKVWLG